jgi:hypothetical protein
MHHTLWLDISLLKYTYHRDPTKTTFWVTALPWPGESLCYPPLQDEPSTTLPLHKGICPLQAHNIQWTKSCAHSSCLGHTKVSVKVGGLQYEGLVTIYVATWRRCSHLAQSHSCNTMHYLSPKIVYSIYSQLTYALQAIPPSAHWGGAMP